MRILLAEDDNKLRATLTRGLMEEGHVVDSFARGDEARDALLAGGSSHLTGNQIVSVTAVL